MNKRITATNANINTLQLDTKELKDYKQQTGITIKDITDNLNNSEINILKIEDAVTRNRDNIIEIERNLESEFFNDKDYSQHVSTTDIYENSPAEKTVKIVNNKLNEQKTKPSSTDIYEKPPAEKTVINVNKVNEKKLKPVLKLLIIGSSIVRDIKANKIEKINADQTRTECIPGGKINTILDKFKELNNQYHIKKVIIHVGGNHLSSENPDEIINNLSTMYKTIKHTSPYTQIYHSNILPRLNQDFLSRSNYINYNIGLLCLNENIKIIKHPQYGNETINFDLLIHDHVHPTERGTSIIAKNMIAVYRNYGKKYV